MEQDKILFKERQRFRQVWLWVVVLGVAGLLWAGFVYQVLLGGTFGNRPASDVQLAVLAVLLGVGLPCFFYTMRLQTEVVPGELRVRFYPFHLRPVSIPLHLVRDFERVTYNPILDYGGWGIRWTFYGKAYNMSGNEGVKLYFYNRKPLLIGSQQPEALYEAIRQAREKR
ncbi:DUF6141 family protein [Pontibacter chitinilyticus]|uniref:DUF6141 family protein n=1 Tax=Pontibacter chitinilyticus TaxID=2674989 RepID=UPI00321AB631